MLVETLMRISTPRLVKDRNKVKVDEKGSLVEGVAHKERTKEVQDVRKEGSEILPAVLIEAINVPAEPCEIRNEHGAGRRRMFRDEDYKP